MKLVEVQVHITSLGTVRRLKNCDKNLVTISQSLCHPPDILADDTETGMVTRAHPMNPANLKVLQAADDTTQSKEVRELRELIRTRVCIPINEIRNLMHHRRSTT